MRKYIVEGFNVELYQEQLDKVIKNNDNISYRVVAIAKFMAYHFPKIPYFWGGGHGLTKSEMMGLDKEWGTLDKIKYSGSKRWRKDKLFPKSLDCSGFVSWCLINAGFDISPFISMTDGYVLNSGEMTKLGHIYKITDGNLLCNISLGDIAYMKGHVGIIIDINFKNKSLLIVHVSGSGDGLNITEVSTTTGHIINDDLGEMRSFNHSINRIGKLYFTEVIHVEYEK